VWQPPQPAEAKTFAPAESLFFALPPQPATTAANAAARAILGISLAATPADTIARWP
jgi:hypothetical protein